MKKIILSVFLIANTLLLTGCITTSTIGTAISVSNDRRTGGEVLDDKMLMFKLFNLAGNDKSLNDSHLNFMVYNQSVLVTGEVPNQSLSSLVIQKIQQQGYRIDQTFNELTIGPNTGLLNRAKDTAITLQIEALFLDQEVFHPTHVRVMTENQTVYLMGAVTQREADKVVSIIASAKGVKKIVKYFTYIKTRPAAEIERDRQRDIAKQKQAKPVDSSGY